MDKTKRLTKLDNINYMLRPLVIAKEGGREALRSGREAIAENPMGILATILNEGTFGATRRFKEEEARKLREKYPGISKFMQGLGFLGTFLYGPGAAGAIGKIGKIAPSLKGLGKLIPKSAFMRGLVGGGGYGGLGALGDLIGSDGGEALSKLKFGLLAGGVAGGGGAAVKRVFGQKRRIAETLKGIVGKELDEVISKRAGIGKRVRRNIGLGGEVKSKEVGKEMKDLVDLTTMGNEKTGAMLDAMLLENTKIRGLHEEKGRRFASAYKDFLDDLWDKAVRDRKYRRIEDSRTKAIRSELGKDTPIRREDLENYITETRNKNNELIRPIIEKIEGVKVDLPKEVGGYGPISREFKKVREYRKLMAQKAGAPIKRGAKPEVGELNEVKKRLDELYRAEIDPRNFGGSGREARELTQMNDLLKEEIRRAAPEYTRYLHKARRGKESVDKYRIGEDIAKANPGEGIEVGWNDYGLKHGGGKTITLDDIERYKEDLTRRGKTHGKRLMELGYLKKLFDVGESKMSSAQLANVAGRTFNTALEQATMEKALGKEVAGKLLKEGRDLEKIVKSLNMAKGSQTSMHESNKKMFRMPMSATRAMGKIINKLIGALSEKPHNKDYMKIYELLENPERLKKFLEKYGERPNVVGTIAKAWNFKYDDRDVKEAQEKEGR